MLADPIEDRRAVPASLDYYIRDERASRLALESFPYLFFFPLTAKSQDGAANNHPGRINAAVPLARQFVTREKL